MLQQFGLAWLAAIALATAAAAAEPAAKTAEKPVRSAVIGDAIGGDPILREAVMLWSESHPGAFEIKRLEPEALTAPDNGCDAAVTSAGDELTFGNDFTVVPYALEPVLIAVPHGFGLERLTATELKRIYSGKIDNWKQLGLPDLPVVRAGVPPEAPGGRVFLNRIMGWKLLHPEPPKPGDEILPGMIVYRKLPEAEALAAGTEGLILFGSWELAGSSRLKIIAVDGVTPDQESIREGRYRPVLTRTAFCRSGSALLPLIRQMPEIFTRRPDRIPDFLPPPAGK